jgi:hypothetical protein
MLARRYPEFGMPQPNPDKPEKVATKAPRHKGNLQLLFIFASLCLGGVNVLSQNAKK